MTALPSPNEDTPLVLPIGRTAGGTTRSKAGQTVSGLVVAVRRRNSESPRGPLTRTAVHTIVKHVFSRAADRLRKRGGEYVARADLLENASAHWLRHSAGSHMADRQVDLRDVRDNFGHASLTTASVYLHVGDDRGHQETHEKISHRPVT